MTFPARTHHLSSCHRHPSKPITGFCAACLSERLAGIDPATRQEMPISITCPAAELRRSKSCSGAKREGIPGIPEPRRSSCDVRAQNTLWDLLHVERSGADKKLELEVGNLGFELKEEDEEEIRVSEVLSSADADVIHQRVLKVEEFDEGIEMKTMKEHIDLEWLSKKNTGRDFRDIAGSFWQAASVFSKKLKKWRGKQKLKDSGGGRGDDPAAVKVGKPDVRRYRETQSEVGDYGFGRRSCDTDPRMSLDAGHFGLGRRSCDADPRMSLDAAHYGLGRRSCDADPRMSLEAGHYGLGRRRSCDVDPRMSLDADDVRFSLDEPRASWDGYLLGRAYPRLAPLLSVVEDVKVPLAAGGFKEEEDALDVEKMKAMDDEQKSPGGSAQTRDYYSLQRRRRSFDRRAAGLEVEELKSISNAKVTPETTGLFHGAKLLITEKELMESKWNQPIAGSHSSESSRSNDIASVPNVVLGQKGFKKFTGWHKVWHIWGSIQRQKQGESKCEAEDKYLGGNVINTPLAESLQKLRRVEGNGAISQKLIQSYGVSSRNSYGNMTGLVHNMSSIETKANANKRREELVLQRNRNAPYSPTNHDNGLLRFYLTPLRSSRGKSGKSRLKTSHSISRNVL